MIDRADEIKHRKNKILFQYVLVISKDAKTHIYKRDLDQSLNFPVRSPKNTKVKSFI